MFKYAINLTDAEVQMCDGKVAIPVKGFGRIFWKNAETEEVIDCIQRGWISELMDTEPTAEEIAKKTAGITLPPEIVVEGKPTMGTLEPPKRKKPEQDKTLPGKATALGRGTAAA